MSAEHTPGPWTVDTDGCIYQGEPKVMHFVHLASAFREESYWGEALAVANARRIVACVNAAEGISTEALEACKDIAAAGIATTKSIEAQRDELAEVVRALLAGRETMDGRLLVDENSPLIDAARTALAKLGDKS